jgi:hypothetical protein
MQMMVGTTPVRFPGRGNTRPMMQNLGPGDIYFDNKPDVTPETGIQMAVGAIYEYPTDLQRGGGFVYMVSDQDNTDLRYITVG